MGLAVDYAGFHATSLVYFRQRLLEHQESRCVFHEQFEMTAAGPAVRPQEASGTAQSPHDPEAQWAAKDQKKAKAWVGHKARIAETVAPEQAEAKPKDAPTEQFIPEITTTGAIASDLDGRERLEQQQQEHGLGCADELYVDAAFVTDETLARASEAGRQLVGPAMPAQNSRGVLFTTEQFDISIAEHRAICPAGRASTQCSRPENEQTGRVSYRFEWSYHCDACPLNSQCTKAQNGIEGTISESAGNGGRRTRYRGLAKTSPANYLHGAAINVKRWTRLLQHGMSPNCVASA